MESGGDYFSELGGEIISESGGGLPRNLQACYFKEKSYLSVTTELRYCAWLSARAGEGTLDDNIAAVNVVDPGQLNRIEATHRGFLYQHLFVAAVLLRAAEFKVLSVLVESDEDLEILSDTGRIYVQVKLRADTLGWSDISKAMDRFSSYRTLHQNGTRAGVARFVVASSALPRASLIERMKDPSWPTDVTIEWPGGPSQTDEILPAPKSNVIEMAEYARSLAGRLPFAVLTPETLVWKLAGVVTLTAAGQPPRTDHRFRVSELPELFEQLIIQLQDFPAPPSPYRDQEDEPYLSGRPVRFITGYSGSGKTSWAANAALHTNGTFIYFDAQDIPGGGLSAGLAREIAARIYQEKGGLGKVLLPGVSDEDRCRGSGPHEAAPIRRAAAPSP